MSLYRPLNVAVIGAGPAGIYTSDMLMRHKKNLPVRVDLYERLPAPFGLVRYGIAPDHPQIEEITATFHDLLHDSDVRLIAGVDVGVDIHIEDLRRAYDAVVLAIGADQDTPLDIPGADLPGSFGAAQFVSWYEAHPDLPPTWELDSSEVAVIGAGNVALDVTRMLVRSAEELRMTEIPDHVHEVFASSPVTDVHVFARRGPAEAQFSPLELRRLDDVPGVDIIVDPNDLVFERSSRRLMESFPQRKQVSEILTEWSQRESATLTAPRRVHLHFMQAPDRIDGESRVQAMTVERTRHLVNGMVEGTGEMLTYPVGQVYRAIGYSSRPVAGTPFDPATNRLPHTRGRVISDDGTPAPGLYVSGWIKRGPVGLIGSTKSDSHETVRSMLDDLEGAPQDLPSGYDAYEEAFTGHEPSPSIDWNGWLNIDNHERARGQEQGRDRAKVHERKDLMDIARRSLT